MQRQTLLPRLTVVPLGGLEPPTLTGYAPKAYAYTSSATEARLRVLYCPYRATARREGSSGEYESIAFKKNRTLPAQRGLAA